MRLGRVVLCLSLPSLMGCSAHPGAVYGGYVQPPQPAYSTPYADHSYQPWTPYVPPQRCFMMGGAQHCQSL